jgi:hypothetical protein
MGSEKKLSKKRLWDMIGRLPCVVTGSTLVSIHHVQGGTMQEALVARGLRSVKGIGMRGYSDFLVIPLHPNLHYLGPNAIDGHIGRRTWEGLYGTQSQHIDAVGLKLGLDLWLLHAQATDQLESYLQKTQTKSE